MRAGCGAGGLCPPFARDRCRPADPPLGGDAPEWFPDWRGKPVAIIASGPSATAWPAEGEWRVVAVNTSWRLAPDADLLYAADARWWRANRGVPGFAGLKATQDGRVEFADVHVVGIAGSRLSMRPGFVGHGGNGGFQALNLVLQFGARRIALAGFDMHDDAGVHWHDRHRGTNPDKAALARWRAALDKEMGALEALGAEVVNASPGSALTAFLKMPAQDVRRMWR